MPAFAEYCDRSLTSTDTRQLDIERVEAANGAVLMEPVTRDEAYLHCRVDRAVIEEHIEDPLMDLYIASARQECETYLRRSLITQTFRLYLWDLPGSPIRLHYPPIQSIDQITYVVGNKTHLLDPAMYTLQGNAALLSHGDCCAWPQVSRRPRAVSITYKAGYGIHPSAIPADIRRGLLLTIGSSYNNRENDAPIMIHPLSQIAKDLWRPYRWATWI